MRNNVVEIIKYKPVGKNTLVGYVDIFIPKSGMEIYGCTYHKKGSQEWISFPSREYTTKEGEKKYASYVRFRERNHQDAFSREVIAAINKDFEGKSLPKEESMFGDVEDVPF